MQNPRSPQRKGSKFLDVKVFIVALSIAITIGLWNLFSVNAFHADLASPTPVEAPPVQDPAATSGDLPPLPTLVPLVEVSVSGQQNSAAPVAALSQAGVPTQLRSVSAPTTTTIVQKNKPLVVDSGASSGGGGGGGSRAVTRTRSSRPK